MTIRLVSTTSKKVPKISEGPRGISSRSEDQKKSRDVALLRWSLVSTAHINKTAGQPPHINFNVHNGSNAQIGKPSQRGSYHVHCFVLPFPPNSANWPLLVVAEAVLKRYSDETECVENDYRLKIVPSHTIIPVYLSPTANDIICFGVSTSLWV